MSRKKQIAHLRKDKILRKLVDTVGTLPSRKNNDLYLALLRSIVSQQLSVKAAETIWNRFLALFEDRYPQANKLLMLQEDDLRAVGLSFQKAGYMKNIARFSLERTLDYQQLKKMADDELIDYLVQIKGVGRWTVEMVMMFALERSDVLPLDDLGIQNGMAYLYQLEATTKRELFAKMSRVAETWRPYRSLACRYIWRYKDLKL